MTRNTPLPETSGSTNFSEPANFEELETKIGAANRHLATHSAMDRVEWTIKNLPQTQIVSSSFGIQSAVMLHLMTQHVPDIPVIFIDTGYLFPETYRFVDQLTVQLNLNLKVYSSAVTSAWQEKRYGKLWEQGLSGLERYNHLNKVEPMTKALNDNSALTWYSGLRREQSSSRKQFQIAQVVDHRCKVYPLIDWNNKDVHQYLKRHNLPYHPLWDKGYESVGDWHSSLPMQAGMTVEQSRFQGLKRECGLHG